MEDVTHDVCFNGSWSYVIIWTKKTPPQQSELTSDKFIKIQRISLSYKLKQILLGFLQQFLEYLYKIWGVTWMLLDDSVRT